MRTWGQIKDHRQEPLPLLFNKATASRLFGLLINSRSMAPMKMIVIFEGRAR